MSDSSFFGDLNFVNQHDFAAPFSAPGTAPDLSNLKINDDNNIATIDNLELALNTEITDTAESFSLINSNLEPIRIEAESMTTHTYRVRDNRSASGGKIISLFGGSRLETGTASFAFDGQQGTYDVILGYYDENDGHAHLEVAQNDSLLASWKLDKELGSPLANNHTLTTQKVAEGITVQSGDMFTITGTETLREHARLDYLEFVPFEIEESAPEDAIRINAGGGDYTDSLGQFWQEDEYFTPRNQTFSRRIEIEDTKDDPIFQTERFGEDFSYKIPVGNDTYDIRLHFAEIFFESEDRRVFDVSVEGEQVSDDLDLVAEAGVAKAFAINLHDIQVNDGFLNLDLVASVNNAKISGIEIISTTTHESIRINAGGHEYRDRHGQIWQADEYFTPRNQTFSQRIEIEDTEDDPIFQTERFGRDFSYRVPVENGTYDVNLYFAEIFFDREDRRVFDVSVEGQQVIDNLDLVAEVGPARPFVLELNELNIADGFLNLDLVASVNNAKISGIEIIPVEEDIVLLEGNDFRVAAQRAIAIPDTPSVLSFTYTDLNFDTSDADFINDAFEVALVDSEGNSLVNTIAGDRDAFFNLTEGEGASLAKGVTVDGQTVTVNLAGIAPGTEGTLSFRLVNNDDDVTTTVRIADIVVEAADVTPPGGVTPALTELTATEDIDFDRLADVSGSFVAEYQRTSLNEETDILYVDVAVSNQGQYLVDAPLIVVVDRLSDPTVRVLDADGFTPEGLPYYDFTNLVNDGTLDPNEITGSRTISFLNPNGVQFDYELQFLGALNQAPELISEPKLEAIAGKAYTYNVEAVDLDGDNLTYDLLVAPEGMTINDDTGEISWSPQGGDIGNQTVVIKVSDGRGGVAEQSYTLSAIAAPPNRPPLITSVPVVDANVGSEYSYQVVATDPDGDELTYSIVEAPEGMAFDDANTGQITWIPTASQLDIQSVTIQVEDGSGGTTTQEFAILVQPEVGNNAPVFVSDPLTQFNLPGLSNPASGLVEPLRLDLDLALGAVTTEMVSLTLAPESANDLADIVFVVDESGSMSGEWQWLAETAPALLAALEAAGVDSTRFAFAGYGGSDEAGEGHLVNLALRGEDATLSLFGLDGQFSSTADFGTTADLERIEQDGTSISPGQGSVAGVPFNLTNSLLSFSSSPLQNASTDLGKLLQPIEVTLLNDGSYLFALEGSTSFPVDFNFELTEPAVTRTSLNLGETISGTIAEPGERNIFTFDATAGQLLYFEGLSADSNQLDIYLSSPTGVELGGGAASTPITSDIFGSDVQRDAIAPFFLSETGTYRLVVDGSGESTGDYSFRLSDAQSAATLLPLNTPVTGSLESGIEVDLYRLEGTAGQRIAFTDLGIAPEIARISMYGPDGERIRLAPSDFEQLLPSDGTYYLVVEAYDRGGPFDYSFEITDISDTPVPTTGFETVQNQTGAIAAGEQASFTFTASAGLQIYFDNQGSDSDLIFNLVDPQGTALFSNNVDDLGPLILPYSGAYTLTVTGSSSTSTGNYRFNLVNLEDVPPLSPNPSSLEPGTEVNLYQFAGLAGERISLEDLGSDSGLSAALYGPDGQSILLPRGLNSLRLPLKLDGSYVLALNNTNTNDPVNYNFELVKSETIFQPLTLGATTPGNITERGEQNVFTFDGTVGQQLYFDGLSADSGINATLYRLSNNTLGFTPQGLFLGGSAEPYLITDTSNDGGVIPSTFTLTETGTYRLVIDGEGDTGEYSFRLFDIAAIPELPLDTPVEESLATGTETNLYRFEGQAGQQIFFDDLGSDTGARARLYKPNGENFGNFSSIFDFEEVLPVDGTYVLAIEGLGGSDPVNYSFEVVTPETTIEPLTLGEPITGSISERGEDDIYTFSGTAGQRLYFDGLGGPSRAFLYSLNGNGILEELFARSDSGVFILPDTGTYQLVFRELSSATGDYNFRLLDAISAAEELPLGEPIQGNLASGFEAKLYQFEGRAGQRISFDDLGSDSGARIIIYQPDGQVTGFSSILDFDGTYILAVEGLGTSSSVNYSFEVTDISDPPVPVTGFGDEQSGTVAPGEQFTYSFEAPAGLPFYFDNLGSDTGFSLFDPEGAQLGGFSIDILRILPESGTYTITTSGSGDYRFNLLNLESVPNLTLDLPVEDSLARGFEAEIYQFEGLAGQRIFFDDLGSDSDARFTIYGPDLQEIIDRADRDFETLLPSDGTYFLAVTGPNSETPVNYNFELVTPTSTVTAIDLGVTYPGQITERGEQDVYAFVATAGQQIYFDGLSADSNISYKLFSPTGASLNPGLTVGLPAGENSGPYTLTETGTYRLVIDGEGTAIGDYSFQIRDLGTIPTLSLNTPISNSFDPGTETDLYRFEGSKGQQLAFLPLKQLFGSATEFAQTMNYLIEDGFLASGIPSVGTASDSAEDGYEAINFALNNLDFRPGAAVNVILVTDEDLDILDASLGINSFLANLDKNALLNVVVNGTYIDSNGARALGFDADGNAYLADGAGGFISNSTIQSFSGVGNTKEAYLNPIFMNDGAAWDLNQLRIGGLTATSFTNAFTEIKTQEILNQLNGDVELVPSDPDVLFENLTGSIPDVQPGETITFETQFTGDGIARSFDLQFVRSNSGLILGSIPVTINNDYNYNAQAIDADGDLVSYSLLEFPTGATINQQTGQITWEPTETGEFLFTVQADDGRGGIATQDYQVTISSGEPNQDPTISSVAPTEAAVNRPYSYTVTASDPDGDALAYYLQETPEGVAPPEGLAIDRVTGEITWTPSETQTGSNPVEVLVLDGRGGRDTESFAIEVNSDVANQKPGFNSTPVTTTTLEKPYQYQATATDANGDILTYDLPVKPEGMTVDAATGTVVWQPTLEQVGTHDVILRVKDGQGGVDIQSFQVQVDAENTAPVITSNPPEQAVAGLPYQYRVRAQDAEGDQLKFSLNNPPAGVSIDENTGVLNFLPATAQIGTQDISITVSDDRGGSTTQTYTLNVVDSAVNEAPTINSTPRKTIAVGGRYLYQIEAFDPNGDPISYNFDTAPDGMSITQEGLIEWQPTSAQFGSNSVVVRVEDGRGGSDLQVFTIEVTSQSSNRIPTITSEPNFTANLEQTYQYNPEASDPDGDLLVWSLNIAPQGMSLDANTGQIRWNPTAEQIGINEVEIAVIDAQGGFATQSFTLEVRGVNTPPAISSVPPTTAVANESYTYAIEASDLEGDPLKFSLLTFPEGMTINANTGEIQWTTSSSGQEPVEILVSDAQGGQVVQGYTIVVAATAANQAPSITSTPLFTAANGEPYEYQVTASDPENDNLTFSLIDPPAGMTIGATTGLIQWTPDAIGEETITVAVVDPSGAGSAQRYTLTVNDNLAPTLLSEPVEFATVGATYRYDVQASDPNGDPLSFSLVEAPEGMEIDDFGRISWTPTDEGVQPVTIAIADPFGATDTDTYDLTVNADEQAPQVNLLVSAEDIAIGGELTVAVQGTDNVGIETLTLTVNGNPVAVNAQNQATIQIDTVGAFELVATATDAAGNTSLTTTTVFGIDPSDVDAPVVAFTDLTELAEITSPQDIIGTVEDDNLESYTLAIAPFGTDNFTEISSDDETVTDGVLGQLDPSILTNDTYTLRLFAQDTGGNESVVETQVSVLGELKITYFELSFTDLTVPVSGIPISLSRTYNSQNANQQDDFGFGWRLEIADTDLRTSVAKTGAEELGINNPYFAGARVYVKLPGESRQGFTFSPQPARGLKGSFLGIWEPVFVPDPGVTSSLTVENFDLRQTDTGEFFSYDSSLAYNPSSPVFGGTFTLTTKEGIAYEIDGLTGDARTISDRNGNVLSFTNAGIISSSGQQITFERNPQGQITAAIDPIGMRIEFEYDANGDLVAVTDRENNVTRFEYNEGRPHFLEEVIDPLQRPGVRSEYDEKGRLVKIFDADGEDITLIHDPDNFTERVEDQLGNPTIFEYDDRGNVLTEIDAEEGVIERTYDANNNILTETVFDGINPEGNTTTFTYDDLRNVLTETDPLGNTTIFTYDSFSNVLTTTDPQGITTTNTYDANGNLTSISGQANGTTTLSYDARGNLTSFGDAAGTTDFEYDSFGNVTREVDAEKNETIFTYDANGNQLTATTTLTTPNEVRTLVTKTEYDAEGRVIKVTDPEEGVTETIYDAVGNVVEEIDAKERSTKFEYDDRGLLTETILPDDTPNDDTDNPFTETEYDAAGRVTAEIDELERKTEFEYDGVGRVTKTILPDETPNDDTDNPFTEIEYDDAGRVTAEIDERGNRTEFVNDKAGQVVETILPDDTPDDDSDNPRFTTTYDDAGRQKTQTDALGNVTEFFYDDLGRSTGQEFADGTTVSSEFDEAGRLIARTDQDDEVTRFEYDALGRLTAVIEIIDGLEQRTEYGYDELDNLTSQKDARGRVTKFEYDGLGRRIATELPEGQRSTTEYDAVGNVISTTDFNNETITYEYDERDRLVAKNFPDGSITTYSYTLTGQRETVVDERGTTNYEYDAQDRLTKRIDPDGREIAYTYDAAGNRTSVDIPSGAIAYTFDELNRLETVTDAEGGVTTYQYNDNSNLIRTEFSNGTVEIRNYDTLNRLTYIENKDVNGDVISSFLYELDAEGNRTQVTEHDGRIVKYTYDDLDRLEKEEIFDLGATVATRTIEYAYDEVGNRLSRVDSAEGTTIYTYDDNDRLETETTNEVATTYTYDDNGNTISKTTGTDTVTYNWDSENRLVGADTDGDGTVDVTNQYDVDGVRVAQNVNGEETRFLIDTNRPFAQVLEEYTPGGIIKVSYVYGNDLISQERNGEKSFYHVDGLGSTRALSDTSGLATDRYIYDAFGQVLTKIGDTSNSYLYTGEQRDDNLGLDYLRARYLDVKTGRFVSRDSFEGFISDPVTLHLYLYANSNPVNNIDPSGKISLAQEAFLRTTLVSALSSAVISGGITGITTKSLKAAAGAAVIGFLSGLAFGAIGAAVTARPEAILVLERSSRLLNRLTIGLSRDVPKNKLFQLISRERPEVVLQASKLVAKALDSKAITRQKNLNTKIISDLDKLLPGKKGTGSETQFIFTSPR